MTETEPMALAGLGRLVLHARGKLAAATLHRPEDWADSVDAIRYTDAVVARTLAVEVLTLVADCLPAPEPVTDSVLADFAELLSIDETPTLAEVREQVELLVKENGDLHDDVAAIKAERDRLCAELDAGKGGKTP